MQATLLSPNNGAVLNHTQSERCSNYLKPHPHTLRWASASETTASWHKRHATFIVFVASELILFTNSVTMVAMASGYKIVITRATRDAWHLLHSALGHAPSGVRAINAIHPSRPWYNYYVQCTRVSLICITCTCMYTTLYMVYILMNDFMMDLQYYQCMLLYIMWTNTCLEVYAW